MAGSLQGMRYETLLLGGWDLTTNAAANALTLDNELASAERLGAFKKMLTYPQCRAAIMNDPQAREILARSNTALLQLLDLYGAELHANTGFMSVINGIINTSACYLKRDVYTSGSGTWTPHANGLWRCYALLVAPGGNGANSTSTNAGGGGGGGETVGNKYTTMPSSGLAYSVGVVNTSNTTFSSFTATRGANGTTSNGNSAAGGGAGTTNGGGSTNLYSSSVTTDLFQIGSFTHKGGNGGSGGTSTNSGQPGTAGARGSGGAGGIGGAPNGLAGTGIGSGGGGGLDSSGAFDGQAAAANSGCGGGGASDNTANGGAGGSGLIIIYSFYKRAA